MIFSHISKATALGARLPCCCEITPLMHEEGGGRAGAVHTWECSLYRPDTKHRFPLETPASGHNISSDLHRPSGVIHHLPHPYPCLQMGTQQHGHFYWGRLGRMRSAFPIRTSAQPGKLALPLKKVGRRHKSMVSCVLMRMERANQSQRCIACQLKVL